MSDTAPLIKGLFINSHISRLRAVKSEDAVIELEYRLGRLFKYDDFSEYPVREEVEILEHVVDILYNDAILPEARSFEAGRIHFQDFADTAFGSMVLKIAPHTSDGFKKLMSRASYVAKYVFKHTNFSAAETGPCEVTVTMENNDYSIDHFRGFFHELASHWGLRTPEIAARETAPGRFEYRIRWAD